MLVRLDNIVGVAESFANYTGTMLKVELEEGPSDSVVEAIRDELAKANRKPTLLDGADFETALHNERWQNAAGVRFLTSIEYMTFTGRWLRHPLVFIPLSGACVFTSHFRTRQAWKYLASRERRWLVKKFRFQADQRSY